MTYQVTLALFKPSLAVSKHATSEVLQSIKKSGLDVLQTKKLFWHVEDAGRFYVEHRGKFYYDRLVAHATSGPIMALLLGGEEAIARWRAQMGPARAYKAAWEQPDTLRARFGISDTRNAFHGSDSEASARQELAIVFKGIDIDYLIANR